MRKLLTTGALAVATVGLMATTVAAGPPAGRPGPPPAEDIVQIAAGNPDFDILVAAVGATDLVEALSGDDQLTVFAPTDAAFQALFDGASEAEIAAAVAGYDESELAGLRSILLHHVTPGRRDVNSVLPVSQLPTLNGTALTKDRGTPTIDTSANEEGFATVRGTVPASNGIIHVIDAVLLP